MSEQLIEQLLNCGFRKKSFIMNAPANPPNSDDRYAQLTRGAFIINDFLQNPHFSGLKIRFNPS